MIVKVCGMRDPDNIRAVEQCGPDWMGMIAYARSPRYVDGCPRRLPRKAMRWGVFVNASLDNILRKADDWQLHGIQLHGSETPDMCHSLQLRGFRVMKALALLTPEDAAQADAYADCCHYLLFDTPCTGHGGSGRPFNWLLLDQYQGHTPFLLSGGIGPDSLPALKKLCHPQWVGIDLNSRFETAPGIKDVNLLQHFIQAVRRNFPADGTTTNNPNLQKQTHP